MMGTMGTSWAAAGAGVLVVVAVACSSSDETTPVDCKNGDVFVCRCVTGREGTQVCQNGTRSVCACDAGVQTADDAGMGPDTGPAAEIDACVPQLVYVDADRDGFGAGGAVSVCVPSSSGYAAQAGDCDDQDSRAFPGQTLFLPGTTKGKNNGDFNCDGTVELELGAAANFCASTAGPACGAKNVWYGQAAKCGETAPFLVSCSFGGGTLCQSATEPRTQGCR